MISPSSSLTMVSTSLTYCDRARALRLVPGGEVALAEHQRHRAPAADAVFLQQSLRVSLGLVLRRLAGDLDALVAEPLDPLQRRLQRLRPHPVVRRKMHGRPPAALLWPSILVGPDRPSAREFCRGQISGKSCCCNAEWFLQRKRSRRLPRRFNLVLPDRPHTRPDCSAARADVTPREGPGAAHREQGRRVYVPAATPRHRRGAGDPSAGRPFA